jgi:BolA protein
MTNRAEQIRAILKEAFHPTYLSIEDESRRHAGHAGAKEQGGGHFCIEIISDHFRGKSRIERHRIINRVLKDLFGPTIHALKIRARTPEEQQ